MPTFDRVQLAERIRASGLVCSEWAARIIESFSGPIESEAVGSAKHLLVTYERRLWHLRGKRGEHASQLAESVSELCERLREYSGEYCLLDIPAESPYSIVVFLAMEGQQVLGCMRTASRLEMDALEWDKLWNHEADS
jgi:hypothetical protein